MFKQCIHQIAKIEKNIEYKKYTEAFHKFDKIILLGNGGSNAIASHISEDAIKFHKKISLSFSDPSMLTCFINDYKMENAYAKFLEVHADRESLIVLISSSGESKNMINAAKYCIKNNITYGILTGFNKNNKLRKVSKKSVFDYHINSNNYGVIECVHQIFLHAVI